jgi:hypothetical protein
MLFKMLPVFNEPHQEREKMSAALRLVEVVAAR